VNALPTPAPPAAPASSTSAGSAELASSEASSDASNGASGSGVDKSRLAVRAMFSDIARTYDVLNHGLSLNLDRRWRRRAVTLLGPRAGQLILDGCCGTGDLSLEIARQCPASRVVGSDFALPMLRLAQLKARPQQVLQVLGEPSMPSIPFVAGDGLRLPFASSSFEAVAIAFGVRNFEDTEAGLIEAARVLKPGGKLLVLEFVRPDSILVRRFFQGFNALLAPLGRAISGHPSAYKYLPQSVGGFCTRRELALLLSGCGLGNVRAFSFSGGVSTAFLATKPAAKSAAKITEEAAP